MLPPIAVRRRLPAEEAAAVSRSGVSGRRVLASLCALAVMGTACSPSPTGSPAASSTPTQAAQATPTLADTIRVALPGGGPLSVPFGPLTNATSRVFGDDLTKAWVVNFFLHDALYRYDEHARPVPSLAQRCDPSADGLTITCQLAQAAFSDGAPVTAADVVFTYRVMTADTHVDSDFLFQDCVANIAIGNGCLWEILDSTLRIDDRTVAFRLKRPLGPFFTLVLPSIWIDSEKVVRAAYERFRAKAVSVDAADLDASARGLQEAVEAPAGNCVPLLQDAVQLAARAGLFVPNRAEFDYLPGGEFDACGFGGYAFTLSLALARAAASLAATDDITALALVYPHLDIDRAPVGAGPYRLTEYIPNQRVELEASPTYGAAPATKHVVFQIYPDEDAAAKAVATGEADWIELWTPGAFPQLTAVPSLRTGHAPFTTFYDLSYNVRPGRLFSDVRLRQAVERCVDKPAAVLGATDGQGIPAYASVTPGTWPYDEALPKPARDVAAGKALVEAAGWTVGTDGIYAKSGQRLAATIYVRTDDSRRVKFAQIIGLQTRDCGMDLRPNESDFGGALSQLRTWPNVGPDTDQPFELYAGGEASLFDPLSGRFLSSQITTKANPEGANYGGFSDPRADELMRQIETTYDIDTRADLARQYQEILAAQQPVLFGWHDTRQVAAAAGLRTVDGPLDLDLPFWNAFPERLVLEAGPGS
jgi:ABC-type transport system substrate-binding protein